MASAFVEEILRSEPIEPFALRIPRVLNLRSSDSHAEDIQLFFAIYHPSLGSFVPIHPVMIDARVVASFESRTVSNLAILVANRLHFLGSLNVQIIVNRASRPYCRRGRNPAVRCATRQFDRGGFGGE